MSDGFNLTKLPYIEKTKVWTKPPLTSLTPPTLRTIDVHGYSIYTMVWYRNRDSCFFSHIHIAAWPWLMKWNTMEVYWALTDRCLGPSRRRGLGRWPHSRFILRRHPTLVQFARLQTTHCITKTVHSLYVSQCPLECTLNAVLNDVVDYWRTTITVWRLPCHRNWILGGFGDFRTVGFSRFI